VGERATRTKYVLYDVCHVCGAEKSKPCFHPETKVRRVFKHKDRPKLVGNEWRVGPSWWAQLIYRTMIAEKVNPSDLARTMNISRTHSYRILAELIRPISARVGMKVFNALGYTANYTITLDLERIDPDNPRPSRVMRRRVLFNGQESFIEKKEEV
jgi:hypothetical protein